MHPEDFRFLDLNLLRVFDTVMSEGSLTRAADKLSLTQPAVSNAMRRLRDALGDELLVRHGHGVQPTPRAMVLWLVVREALGALQQSLAPEAFDPATASLTLVLAMADATASTLMPNLVPILEQEAPALTVRVLPRQADEFTCASCFLVHHRSQLAYEKNGQQICSECAA